MRDRCTRRSDQYDQGHELWSFRGKVTQQAQRILRGHCAFCASLPLFPATKVKT